MEKLIDGISCERFARDCQTFAFGANDSADGQGILVNVTTIEGMITE